MSRHARYASRFEFIREAAFALVLREGTAALTRRAVAAELGVGDATVRRLVAADVPLVCLAADEVVRRRRRTWLQLHADADPAALLVPDATTAPTELVWWRLVLDWSRVRVPVDDDVVSLVQRYQLADRGRVDPDLAGGPDVTAPPAPASRHDLGRYVEERRREVGRLVERLAPAAGPADRALLHTVVDGLAIAVCTGRLEAETARELLGRQVGLASSRVA